MINKIFNKSISILLIFIFIFGLIPTMAFAQPNISRPADTGLNLSGFNKSIFDSHFSKADREIDPDRWLDEARLGMTQAIYAWELVASVLYDNPLLFEEAKNQLIKWSEEELETRFSQWLIGRFFGEAAEKALMEFSSMLGETQKKYTWHLNEEGYISFDSQTGDPLVIRPDEKDFSGDLLMWRDEANTIINNSVASLDYTLETHFSDIIAYIPIESRHLFSSIITDTGKSFSNLIKTEFENIAAREEQILTSFRTKDIYSLRKKSEEESARIFTQKLLEETEFICSQGIDNLNAKIEAAYAGTGDLALLGEEWLKLYKEQFDRGLRAWEEAEERFFIRRIEWEQDAFKLYSEGEEVWMEAFAQFEEQQLNWELQAKKLFEDGVALFDNISEDLNKNIAAARKEFELNMAMRIEEGAAKVHALVNMYLVSSSAALTAREHLNFWENQPDYNAEEIKKSQDLYDSYMERALDARDMILANYAELLGTGALKDILSPDASSEDFFLDEYQIALVRAQALVLYWERKTEIAETVNNYAQEFSAGRITEAEGIAAWESAKADYNNSIILYEAELNKLNKIGEDIQEQQTILQNLADRLHEAEKELNRLNTEYSLLVASQVMKQDYLYLLEANISYNLMIEDYRNFLKTGNDALYKTSLEYGMKWEIVEQRESAQEILEELRAAENGTDLEKTIREAAIELLNNEITSEEWYFNIKGVEITEDNVYNQLLKDLKEAEIKKAIALESELEPEDNDEDEDKFDYIGNYELCFNLFDLYDKMASLIPSANQEKWQITAENISALFTGYGINQTNLFLPDPQTIYLNVKDLELFINEFKDCFTILPEWLDYEIDYWKSALQAYFNANLCENNDDVKSWRQFLTEEYIDNLDPVTAKASSWKDGVIEDALFILTHYTNRLNEALALYSQYNMYLSWDDNTDYYSFYVRADKIIEQNQNLILNQILNINNIFNSYNSTVETINNTENEYETCYNKLIAQKELYEGIRKEYFTEADNFLNLGAAYDSQYGIIKKAHENIDQKRFEYEKQDAIRRWASTAYLGVDFINLEDCKEKLTRAQTVLTVLSNIYNEETLRTFENPEYYLLYAEYQQGFVRKIKAKEAAEILEAAIVQETGINKKLHAEYQNVLFQFGGKGFADLDYSDYESPKNLSDWTLYDLITVNDKKLSFLTDENYTFTGIEEENSVKLTAFFNKDFEDSVKELSERMSGYLLTRENYIDWSLAREYIIFSLINSNGDLSFLNDSSYGIGELKDGGSLGSLTIATGIMASDVKNLYRAIDPNALLNSAFNISYAAWERLSDSEKEDLEYYVILTLANDNNGYIPGFSQTLTYDLYYSVMLYVNDLYRYAKKKIKKNNIISAIAVGIPGLGNITHRNMKDINEVALDRMFGILHETGTSIENWITGLMDNYLPIQDTYSNYKPSCDRLDILYGINKDRDFVIWDDIELALTTIDKYDESEINELKNIWELMMADIKSSESSEFKNNQDALLALYYWARDKETDTYTALETHWINEINLQSEKEIKFLASVDDYITGKTDINSLTAAAVNAYGNNSASVKYHFNNIHSTLINDLSIYPDMRLDFYEEFNLLGIDLTYLTTEMLDTRFLAELSVRELEWDLIKKDIKEKQDEWLNAAALIFENGRKDWAESLQKLEKAHIQWQANFQDEYNRVSDEWAIAYLAGLEDKETWLQMAAATVDQASSQAFLSLIGTEGERLSRIIDTREPFGIRGAIPEAQSLMSELLQSAGIVNMSNAFSSMNNISGVVSTVAIRGIGGYSTWDAALAKAAASDLATQANEDINDRETRILALNARIYAEDAAKKLDAVVHSENKAFRSKMDDKFIFTGLWRRNGSDYEKKIVKGATISGVITKTVLIPGYKDFIMEPVSLRTNMDENYLASLNSVAIMGLIENVELELDLILFEIFGNEFTVGKFGKHIGYEPDPYIASDKGDGELGRLMSEYAYWQGIDAKGMGELTLAPWEKRLWNDEGSFFSAPSLRTAGQIAATVAATAVGVALCATGYGAVPGALIVAAVTTSNVILFETADVAFEYKTIDEAFFNVNKAYTTNFISSLISMGFSGAGAGGNIIARTAIAGAQTYTSGVATSVIDGITYTRKDGWGYSSETVAAGMMNTLKNTVTSMASTFTTASLDTLNAGKKLTGFNNNQKSNVGTFNNLAGSLAGQGVNYAMGGDFTINLLNLNQLGGNFSSGLLELHFGRDGTTMNLGTGGADTSLGTLASALNGIKVLNVNSYVNKYVKDDNHDFKSAIALRAQYGYGDDVQIDQLWDILKGETTLVVGNENGDLAAKTIIDENGNRVITINGYQRDMITEEIYRIGAIIGHEAYRDGYGVGDIDASGNVVTKTTNNKEIYDATIARIAMSDRINAERNWFYNYNRDFAFESDLFNYSNSTGDYSLFNDYIQIVYQNDEDYFFPRTSTNGQYQNGNESWRDIPLFNADSKDTVDELNKERKDEAYEKYLSEKAENGEIPISKDDFKDNNSLLKEYGYEEVKFISLYLYGCKFMSTVYGLETITGMNFDPLEVQKYVLENNLYSDKSLLSTQDVTNIMTHLSDGMYNVTIDSSGQLTAEQIYALEKSQQMYLAILEVPNMTGGSHFVMMDNVEFTYDNSGIVTGINAVNVSNPWDGTTITGKQNYTLDEIKRWDILKITPTGSVGSTSYYTPLNSQQQQLLDYRTNYR